MAPKVLPQEEMVKVLNALYQQAVSGILNFSPSIPEFADEYLKKYGTPNKAAKAMLNNQVKKCTTSGFVTGFGGFITMPVTIPANLLSVLYLQMRMIACTAYIAGYDLVSDETQTFVYACLAGVSINEVVKKFGINLGQKLANNSIRKLPGKVLTKINQKLGFRFITKFGEKGLINLGKMVPVVGAFINGGLDYTETKIIAARAYKTFIEGNFTIGDPLVIETNEDLIISDEQIDT